jgi:arylsulfatase A
MRKLMGQLEASTACLVFIVLFGSSSHSASAGEDWFDNWHNSDKWDVVGEAMLNPDNPRRLTGKPGTGVLINGKEGKVPSLVSKRRDYQDVEIHVEFMVAKGANSGVIFHGNHEIQILDSHGIQKLTAGHCGGVYPPAEAEPTYHHLDGGSPPRFNAAMPPGEWQTLDIIFQAPRFDENGHKTAHARFVRVVHNGIVIQENVEVPHASGTNWDRPQHPQGPVIIQGDYGPVALRNMRLREWHAEEAGAENLLNHPPAGFTALFNGKDFTGWRVHPKVLQMWSIEEGVLKSHGLLEEWGADLVTEKEFQDYVLMADFRMPAKSDSGIHFRNLAPAMLGKIGDAEQFNIRSKGGMGQLESFHVLPEDMELTEEQLPKFRYIDPEIGVWHSLKLTVVRKNLTAELNGEIILDRYEYPDGILSLKPNPIRFQKHRFTQGEKPGERNPCPIEFRNIFIKELGPGDSLGSATPPTTAAIDANRRSVDSPNADLLAGIDTLELAGGYPPEGHQEHVAWRRAGLSGEQRATLGQLWNEKERIKPNIVVLLADDLGWKDIGCHDGPVMTPTLDALAAKGVRFTDFYSGAAVCSPSRATLLTGRQHLRAGVYSWIHDYEQRSHLLEREVTLAEVLREYGYDTAHLGKWHLGMPTHNRKKPTPADHGFDYWFATANNAQPSHKNPVNFVRNGTPVGKVEGFACQIVVDEAIKWLEEREESDKPFFLNLWFHEPHAPLAAPSANVSQYGELIDPAATYSGTIDNTDQAIARLLKKLEQVDSPENTLIIYSSDNGSYRADRVGHLRGTKGSNFDGGLRVPGIFYWPGTITKGCVRHEPAGLVDLLPTVCGLLGIDKPKNVHLDGSDLSPLLTGRANEFARHQALLWLLPASQPAVAIREGNFSLVANRDYEFPRDRERMVALRKQIEDTLRRKGTLEEEIRGSTLQKQMFEGFSDKEAEDLRGQYIRLNMFQESWIPTIKAGTYTRFQLFDLAKDPGQRTDLSLQLPDVADRLKQQLLTINASVMTEAPNWGMTCPGIHVSETTWPAIPNMLPPKRN